MGDVEVACVAAGADPCGDLVATVERVLEEAVAGELEVPPPVGVLHRRHHDATEDGPAVADLEHHHRRHLHGVGAIDLRQDDGGAEGRRHEGPVQQSGGVRRRPGGENDPGRVPAPAPGGPDPHPFAETLGRDHLVTDQLRAGGHRGRELGLDERSRVEDEGVPLPDCHVAGLEPQVGVRRGQLVLVQEVHGDPDVRCVAGQDLAVEPLRGAAVEVRAREHRHRVGRGQEVDTGTRDQVVEAPTTPHRQHHGGQRDLEGVAQPALVVPPRPGALVGRGVVGLLRADDDHAGTALRRVPSGGSAQWAGADHGEVVGGVPHRCSLTSGWWASCTAGPHPEVGARSCLS